MMETFALAIKFALLLGMEIFVISAFVGAIIFIIKDALAKEREIISKSACGPILGRGEGTVPDHTS